MSGLTTVNGPRYTLFVGCQSITPPSRLRMFRLQAGLSQAVVAAQLGVSQSLVSMVESGDREVGQYASALAELYGVRRAELVVAEEARNGGG